MEKKLSAKAFIAEVEKITKPPANLEEMVVGRRSLTKRNLELLKDIAEGADVHDEEMKQKYGMNTQQMQNVLKANMDVALLLAGKESPERRKAWMVMEHKKLYRKASGKPLKHDALDVLSELRKLDQGEVIGQQGSQINIFLPSVLNTNQFSDIYKNGIPMEAEVVEEKPKESPKELVAVNSEDGLDEVF